MLVIVANPSLIDMTFVTLMLMFDGVDVDVDDGISDCCDDVVG